MTAELFEAVASVKGKDNWFIVTNFGERFFGERGIMEFLVEEKAKRHSDIEYKLRQVIIK